MMKRKLIMQMRNEWRSNIWMMTELFIVGLVLWLIFTLLNTLTARHQEPEGVDYSDVYVGSLGYIEKESEFFSPYDENHGYKTDYEMLAANLGSNPYVEIVGRGNNAVPYSYNFMGNAVTSTVNGKKESYLGNCRELSPEAVKAIRMHGLNGETPDELAEIIRRGDIILTGNENPENTTDIRDWRGKDAFFGSDSAQVRNIGAVVNVIRRTDYELSYYGNILSDASGDRASQIIIRVKEGRGQEFMNSLNGNDLEFGNVYVSDLQSLEDRKEICHYDIRVLQRNMMIFSIFVLVSVFLGFLGTFWFRTQQRVPELALRKVNGATDADLFRRIIGEGLLLLVIPVILLLPTGLGLIGFFDSIRVLRMSVSGTAGENWIIWSAFAMTVCSLAVMIVAGIWMPARKAMKVEPATALKDQ